MTHPAIAELTASFMEPFGRLGRSRTHDSDAVVLSWPSVPIEIIHACGLRAVVARSGPDPTPAADEKLEPGVFPGRLHQLVEAALTGRLAYVAGIVLPRTSDSDYKCFLYLRELDRLGIGGPYPPIVLFDLLQSDGPAVAAYNRTRVRLLMEELADWSGEHPRTDDLRAAVLDANAARVAARRLHGLRGSTPRLAGAEALPLLGAFWQVAAQRYEQLVGMAAAAAGERAMRTGSRIFVAGAPVDSPSLHAAIEARQAIVVDELGPYGPDAAGDEIGPGEDVLAALAEKYRSSPTTARTPLQRMRQRIEAALTDIDAVVIHLPPDDATFGWDVPWLESLLAKRGIPHLLTGQGADDMPAGGLDALDRLFGNTHRPAVRHG